MPRKRLWRDHGGRAVIATVAVSVLSLLIASCGSAGAEPLKATTTSSASTTTTTTQPPEQKSLTFAVPYLPSNLNPNTPAGDNAVTRQIMVNIWPSVFYENSKYQPTLNSEFMSSAELVSTKPETIVYKINPDAVWSNGSSISAADFIYNWKAQSGLKGLDVGGAQFLPDSTIGYSDIRSVTSSNGGKTVTVVFNKFFSDWESLFNPLVPASVSSVVGWNLGFTRVSPSVEVSGGPYQISTMTAGQKVVLTRNPGYWGKPAVIPKLVFLDAPNPATYASLFQSGSINLVDSPASNLLYLGLKSLAQVSVKLIPSLSVEELLFNMRVSPLSDVKVRQAIALAIDRKAIVEAVLGSYDSNASPAGNNIYPPGLPQYVNDGAKYAAANPKAASALLKSDGYSRSANGVLEKDGKPLVLTISVDDSNQNLLYVEELITEELSAVGIVVNSVNYPLNSLVDSVLNKGNFDMAIVGETGSTDATFHVSRYQPAHSGGRGNYMGYSSKPAEKLIEQASTELDPATSANTYNKLDKLIWTDLPTLPLYSVPDVLAYDKGYHFIGRSSAASTIFWNSGTWQFIPPG